jgi:hypothetical protein
MTTENELNECRHTSSIADVYVCDDFINDGREIPNNPEFLNHMSSRSTRREGGEVICSSFPPPALFPRHDVLQRSLSTSYLSSDPSTSASSSLEAAARTTPGVDSSSTCRFDDPSHPADFHAAVNSVSTTANQETGSYNSPSRRICRESNTMEEVVFLQTDTSSHQDMEKVDLVIETVIFDGECDHAEIDVDHDTRQRGSRHRPPEFNSYVFSAKKMAWRAQRVTNVTRKNAVKLQQSPQVAAVLTTTQKQLHSTIRRSVECVMQTSLCAKQNLQKVLKSSSLSSDNYDESSHHDREEDDMTTDDSDATPTNSCRGVPKRSSRTAACLAKRHTRRAFDMTAHTTRDTATGTLRGAGHPRLGTKAKSSAIVVCRQFKRATRAMVKGVRNFEKAMVEKQELAASMRRRKFC